MITAIGWPTIQKDNQKIAFPMLLFSIGVHVCQNGVISVDLEIHSRVRIMYAEHGGLLSYLDPGLLRSRCFVKPIKGICDIMPRKL